MEEKIIRENILCREHIDEIYNLFVNLCENERFSLIPLDFINIFTAINDKNNLHIDKDFWNQIFYLIDCDKDGKINFQDFLKFIYNDFKIILGEVSESYSMNRIW